MKIHSYVTLGILAVTSGVLTVLGSGCAATTPTAPPYDSVVVDKSNPNKTIVEFDGTCACGVSQGRYDVPGKKEYSVTQDGKTYYFSSVAARDRFMEDFQTNAQKAEQNWSVRQKVDG